ncbi:MAG: hypothetical protein GX591_09580 [Planctomycetes bacterium]|nr:hypothetical protein [Planctomycetota bacterium]
MNGRPRASTRAVGGRRRYRRWQWAMRIVVLLVLLVVLLYVALPWWLPTGLLAGRIETALEDTLDTDVTLGDLSVSWRGGVRIASLTAADPLDPAAPPLLTTGEIATDFAPLRLLLTRRLHRLTVRNPRITLRTGADGRWNLPAVEDAKGDGGGLTIRNIHLSDGSVTVALPDAPEPLRLNIADVQILAGDDSPIEHATFTGHLVQDGRRVPIAASVTVQSGGGGDDRVILRGSFSGLDLAPLPALADLDLPVDQVEGTAGGTFAVVLVGRAIPEAALKLEGQNLAARRADGTALGPVDRLALRATGGGDLDRRQATLDHVALAGGGVRLAGSGRFALGPAARPWDGQGNVTLGGTIDAEQVSVLVGRRETWDAWPVEGPVQVAVQAALDRGRIDATLQTGATYTGAARPVALALAAQVRGAPEGWQVEQVSLARTDGPGQVRLRIDDTTFETVGDDVLTATLDGTIEVQDAEALLESLAPGTPAPAWLAGPAGEPVRLTSALRLGPGQAASAEATLQAAGATLAVRAARQAETWSARGSLQADDAQALLGPTGLSGRLTAEADLQDLPAAPRGTVSLQAERLDVGVLRRRGDAPPGADGGEARPPMTPQYRRSLQDRAREAIGAARRWTRGADVAFEVAVARADGLSLAGLVGPVNATDLALEGTVAGGRIEASGGASIQAARLRGRAGTDLAETAPSLLLAGSVENLLATGQLQAAVLELLPEMEVRGTISREVDVTVPLTDVVATVLDGRYAVTPVGQARTTLIDGLLRGLAPPEVIERVLPGLNLAEFVYNRAIATTDYQADGSVRNVATLSGDRYSLYVDGAVGPEGDASYDLGVMVSGAEGGPAWLRQFAGRRIPLLEKSFRITDGRQADAAVTWTFPAESLLRSLIEDNLLRDILPEARPGPGDRQNGLPLDLFDLLPLPGRGDNE